MIVRIVLDDDLRARLRQLLGVARMCPCVNQLQAVSMFGELGGSVLEVDEIRAGILIILARKCVVIGAISAFDAHDLAGRIGQQKLIGGLL